MFRPLLIQASISDFGKHNKDSADISKAFDDRDNEGANQIERYLNNDVFCPGHSVQIKDNRFVVTRDAVLVPGFSRSLHLWLSRQTCAPRVG
jgi:hypothetical protein